MFWKFNSSSSSQIEALLAKEDVTLKEVMDSEDIINECRVQNKSLVDFLLKQDVMQELVTLTTKEPPLEMEEQIRFKYSNIACELLTCDVPALNERLAGDKALLDKLYDFLDSELPLNPLLASFFSKIMGALIAKKTEQNWLSYQFTCLQVLDFLKAKDNFITLLLKHLGTSAIMDLLLKLITQVEGLEMKQNILNWLDSQRIMQSLVSLFDHEVDKERHHNVAQLLCDFIRIARDNQRTTLDRVDPDPLLNTLESSETISLLLDRILSDEKSESAIIGGIQVLLALLDVNQNSMLKFNAKNMYNSTGDDNIDSEQKKRALLNVMEAIEPRIIDFHKLLLNPPTVEPLETTIGVLNPPLGNTRLQVIKLFAGLISSNHSKILNTLISVGTFPTMLDLFFKYPWNNFLHTQVEKCLESALKTYVSEESDDTAIALCKHLLENCKLIDRILDAWKENEEHQSQNTSVRQGYMGHLINLLNSLVELCSTTYLGQYLKDNFPEANKSLEDFKENELCKINTVQASLLGGVLPSTSNNNENDEFSDIPFPQSSALQQQMYTQYQMQHLTAQFIDGYSGFNDDAFTDRNEPLFSTFDERYGCMNFEENENEDVTQQHEIFKQLCAQTINTFDDQDDHMFEEKERTFQTVIEKGDQNETVYSSDSDEESPAEDTLAYTSSDPWKSVKDPWSCENKTVENSHDWADFNSAVFEVNFNNAFDDANKDNLDAIKTNTQSEKQNVGAQEIKESGFEVDKNIPTNGNSDDVKNQFGAQLNAFETVVPNDVLKPNLVQEINDISPLNSESAAGDQGGSNIKIVNMNEPSKSSSLIAGDTSLQTAESTGLDKVA